MNTLLYLIAGHYLGDYGLQNDYIAKEKGNSLHVMIAHCSIQAGTVLLATGNGDLALIEFAIHWVVDTLKCRNLISLNVDQAIHITCRIAYALWIDWLKLRM